mmetsp:Transcript_25408/g.75641  ORF Transcript_25408/g.75641 Transcript_25408/m.75641 type:complete len:280 (+) Transcript_25408:2459-3298(+)
MSSPLMWEPSWSWSAMIMMEPYLSPFSSSSYSRLRSRPTILMMFWISVFDIICFSVASRTFRTLPRSGKTPYLSRPTTLRPATARALAESPSVRISVHSLESLPPASFASSSFGTPVSRVTFPVFTLRRFPRSTFDLARAAMRMRSTMPQEATSARNFSESSHFEPNFDGFVVSVSFVCESKAGFSMRHLMKTQMWFRTWCGRMSTPPFTFFLLSSFTFSMIASTIWSETWLTCVPPRIVQMEFTKLTCWKPPSVRLRHTSQRSEHFSKICGTPCLVSR